MSDQSERIALFDVPLYPITDAKLSGLTHAEQVRQLIAGGATLIQLRDKLSPPRKLFRDAEAALQVARDKGTRLIVNDRVDLALALKADGVHLGQDDLPPSAVRKVLGDRAIIGFSTHNLQQAEHALAQPVDYIAAGPIFTTGTKEDAEPPIGLEGLKEIRAAIGDLPLVAIGGISADNAADVIRAGANAVAVISAVVASSSDITARTADLLQRLHFSGR